MDIKLNGGDDDASQKSGSKENMCYKWALGA